MAQIDMIRHELVDRERWISSARFNRLLAVMQALPGPEAHELCVHLGMRARGRIGGVLAGLGFMLPGFALMMGVGWIYVRLAPDRDVVEPALLGAQAAVLALIVRAVTRIAAHALTNTLFKVLAALAFLATIVGVPFWMVLPAAGVASVMFEQRRAIAALVVITVTSAAGALVASRGWSAELGGTTASLIAGETLPLLALFLTGLKGGLLTFGGAYTAIPFVRQDVVRRGWVSDGAFLDGVAFAHVAPAPLVIFATFAGYLAAGPLGGLAVTVGMFLPAFAFSLLLYERLEAVVEEPRLRAILDGVAAAVVGVIAATLFGLGRSVLGTADAAGLQVFVLAAIAGASLAACFVLKGRWVGSAILAVGAMASWILL